jgi:hypothetical protein
VFWTAGLACGKSGQHNFPKVVIFRVEPRPANQGMTTADKTSGFREDLLLQRLVWLCKMLSKADPRATVRYTN